MIWFFFIENIQNIVSFYLFLYTTHDLNFKPIKFNNFNFKVCLGGGVWMGIDERGDELEVMNEKMLSLFGMLHGDTYKDPSYYSSSLASSRENGRPKR